MVAANVARGVGVNLLDVFGFYMFVLVAFDQFRLHRFDNQVLVGPNEDAVVILNAVIHVLFSIEEDLFLAHFVFKTQFVEVLGATIFGTTGNDSTAGVVVR